ncbi:hypothetical protein [Wenyingzhuangia sp. 2_MG-2023]|uniref:hypothetical protein n=1 Tax=Wenyingzhuangia sp. 2_MG-2023 TaxID=3062639 RepID=UPI0026E2A218|nr:hypothetical protein [Wenyingzhuangia sp. 2_MG-2023]MDO6739438.1 hypothetical protein [Wenyingzhuangia sp. 2_MG-2023]
MQKFQANEELENILLKNNLIETTSSRHKAKGKKSFKKTKSSTKEIFFDYELIRIYKGDESKFILTEENLRQILLYFKLNSVDLKELLETNLFNFSEISERLLSIEKELKSLEKFQLHKPRQSKLNRILSAYQNIEI